jgi:hypothetical protein
VEWGIETSLFGGPPAPSRPPRSWRWLGMPTPSPRTNTAPRYAAPTGRTKRDCRFLDQDETRRINLAWSPGHNGIKGNERADELAKQAVGLASTAPWTSSRSNATRRAKERCAKDWVKEWTRTPKTGHYAIANRFPPSMKPTKHFTALNGKREVFGRLIQCRTGHGYIGEFYQRFVPSENVNCICGEPLQTREHLLRECPRYETHRHILRQVSRDISLPEILGTRDGIRALSEFLEKSGAFTKTGEIRRTYTLPIFEEEPEVDEDELEEEDWDEGEG